MFSTAHEKFSSLVTAKKGNNVRIFDTTFELY